MTSPLHKKTALKGAVCDAYKLLQAPMQQRPPPCAGVASVLMGVLWSKNMVTFLLMARL
jgi:hypothetical protein